MLIDNSTPSVAESAVSGGFASGLAWVEVLVDCPGLQELFTYQIPPQLQLAPGDILSVPFGSTQMGGIAIRCLTQPPAEIDPSKIRPVTDLVCRGFFPAGYWQVLEQVADYYQTPLLQVVKVALPPGILRRSQRRVRLLNADVADLAKLQLSTAAQQLLYLLQTGAEADFSWRYLQQQIPQADRALRELRQRGWAESYLKALTKNGPKQQLAVTLVANPTPDLSRRQAEILHYLQGQGGNLWLADLLRACKTTKPTLQNLESKGYLTITLQTRLRLDLEGDLSRDEPQTLTPAQAEAVQSLASLQGYQQVLLHGVTGSGKTEVYLQAIAQVRRQGKSALVLVPEIGLTPQLTDRFRARFGDLVCVYHSALSEGERYDTWHHVLSPEPHVIIGTRSAVFAPLTNLGLIILDEEHDNGFKQDQPAPCYHARTVAHWRAQTTPCPLILGSATPSLETWARLAQTPQPPTYLSLPERVQARPLPPIQVVDMRLEMQEGNRTIFSRTLAQALEELKERREQGLLFIHRRGHSTFVSCRSCGYVVECPHCSVSLTYHLTGENQGRLRCHYCNFVRFTPPRCPECESPYFKYFGSGTQRVEQELAKHFPELRILRFDSDTTRNKGAHRHLLEAFARGEADLLVGTQMLTKGLDLAQVKLVGVLAADGLLNLPDFRAGERTFQTLTQVAGRAGRGTEPGRVILQTYTPEHPVIEAVQAYQGVGFIASELTHRAALAYPPYGQLVLLKLSSFEEDLVERTAFKLVNYLQAHFQDQQPAVEVLGPAPASVYRVARRYRWQILFKRALSPEAAKQIDPAPIRLPLEELRRLCPDKVRLGLDVDPQNLL